MTARRGSRGAKAQVDVVDGLPLRPLPGPFTADIRLMDLLHAAVVFAPRAPARVVELDLGEAARAPGVVAVLGGGQLPPWRGHQAPLLVTDVVRCASDRLAVVAAETPQAARDAAARVFARLEDSPALWDAGKAHLTTAPRVWPGKPNVTVLAQHRVGRAKVVLPRLHALHRRFTLPWQDPLALEGQSVLAIPTQHGVEVRGALEEPGLAALAVARALGIPASSVAVTPLDMGGALGHRGATASELAALCAVLACRTHRPVALRLTREEELRHGPKRPRCVVDHTLAADDHGRVQAQVVKVLWDGGPYEEPDLERLAHAATSAAGAYDIPNQDITVALARTHNVRPFFPPGAAQLPLTLALEGQMDGLSRVTGVPPLVLRRANLPRGRKGQTAPLARSAATCLELLEGLWPEPVASGKPPAWHRHGVGMALASLVPDAPPPAPVLVEVLGDGSVTVCAGLVEGGGWQRHALAATVARALHVAPQQVTVLPPDARWLSTARSCARGATTVDHAQAAQRACAQLLALLQGHAAHALGVGRNRVSFGPRGFTAGKKRLAWSALARETFARGVPLLATSGTYVGKPAPPAAAAHVARVQVDLCTGAVTVQGLWMVQDVGQALVVDGVRRALEGGARMGLGYALTEELNLDTGGSTSAASLRQTHPLGTLDEPPFKVVLLEGGPPRPVTALASLPAAAAVRNAIANALGDAPLELPCTPERILEVLMGQGLDPLGQQPAA